MIKTPDGFSIEENTLKEYTGRDSNVKVPENVVCIGEGAFRWNSYLNNVELPDSIKKIEDFAFSECSELKDVNIPDGVLSIGDRAFAGCANLCDLMIPNSVTSIGFEAFDHCNKLTIHCKACSYAEKCAKAAGIPVNND